MSYNKLDEDSNRQVEGEEKPFIEKNEGEESLLKLPDDDKKSEIEQPGGDPGDGEEQKQEIEEAKEKEEDKQLIEQPKEEPQIINLGEEIKDEKPALRDEPFKKELIPKDEKDNKKETKKKPPAKTGKNAKKKPFKKPIKKKKGSNKNQQVSPMDDIPESEDEKDEKDLPQDGAKLLALALEEEAKLIQQEKDDAEKINEEYQQKRLNSDTMKRKQREWIRYYVLRNYQYNFHLPLNDALEAWETMNSHQKYVYVMNVFPERPNWTMKQYRKWSTETDEKEVPFYFQFDITCRFWFLCQTYTFRKHLFEPYNLKGIYSNGTAILYARKILFQNMTISFSPWNHYWHSENYVADIWSDVNNVQFTLFRKGKRPYYYDYHARDHKDFMNAAIQDVEFVDTFDKNENREQGWIDYNIIKADSTKKYNYHIVKLKEKSHIHRPEPDDGFSRPDEAQEKLQWELDKVEKDTRCTVDETDFQALYAFKRFNNEDKKIDYFRKKRIKQKKQEEEYLRKYEQQQEDKWQAQIRRRDKKRKEEERKKLEEEKKNAKKYKGNYYWGRQEEEEKKQEKIRKDEQTKKEQEEEEERKKKIQEEKKKNEKTEEEKQKEDLEFEESLKKKPKAEQYKNYALKILRRSRREAWRHFWSDTIIEQLGQFNFWIDKEMIMTRIGAYLPSYSIPNYHQEFLAKFKDSMPRKVIRHKLSQFTVFYKAIQNREFRWPLRPRLDIPYPRYIKDYDTNCKFLMFNRKKDRKEIYYQFGKISWNRFYMEVRFPWTPLNAFAMGLAAIKHLYIFHGEYG